MHKVNLTAIKFTNFKSLGNARFEIKDNITGIYGENGIGKTTVIEAIELLKQDFEFIDNSESLVYENKFGNKYRYIESQFQKYISKGQSYVKLDFDFQVANYMYTYSKCFEFDLENSKVTESISYYNIKRKDKKYLIYNRHVSSDSSGTALKYGLFDKEKILDLEDVNSEYLSLLTSSFSVMPKIIKDSAASGEVNKSRLRHLENIILFIDLIVNSSVIKLDDQSLYTLGIIPLNIHLHNEEREVHGKLPLRQFNYYYSDKEIDSIKSTFSSINNIFAAILNGRELRLDIFDKKLSELSRSIVYAIEVSIRQPNGEFINISHESTGTIKLVAILSAVVELIRSETYLLVIDELDTHVYEYLLSTLINELNVDIKGTFIFTSHNLTLFENLEPTNISIIQRGLNNGKVEFTSLKKANQKTNLRNQYIRSLYLGGENIYETSIAENKLSLEMRKTIRKGG